MMTCPRRMTGWGVWEKTENLDHWRPDFTCSFCGSLAPEYLLGLLSKGRAKIKATDKTYKIYVVDPRGRINKFYLPHFNKSQYAEYIARLTPVEEVSDV